MRIKVRMIFVGIVASFLTGTYAQAQGTSGTSKAYLKDPSITVWDSPAGYRKVATLDCNSVVTRVTGDTDAIWTEIITSQGKKGYVATRQLSSTPVDCPAPSDSQPATFSKSKSRVTTIQVVGTQSGEREYAYTIPGTTGKSTTTCNTNGNGSVYATDNGSTINGNINTDSTTNCTTTTQPSTPPSTHVGYIAQEYVRAIMPDGTHVTLWCQVGFRKCASLQPGTYSAEVKGNTVWMYAHDLSGKEHKVKYKAVGGDW